MKRKILAQELASYLAKHAECDPKVAETFARAFFDVIEQGLLQDKFVKIKGFGTFKLIAVSERESINISTGERFQISSHTKISFIPDNTMKELVNRPFAHFTSVDLNDETDIKEFDDIDRQIEEIEKERREQAEAKMAEQEATQDAADGKVEQTTVETTKEVESDNQITSSWETPAGSNLSFSEKQPAIVYDNEDKTDNMNEDNKDLQDNCPPKETAGSSVVISEEKAGEEAESAKNTHKTQNDNAAKNNFVTKSSFETQPFGYIYTEKPPKKKRDMWKAIAIVLGVLLLMVVCYLAGYFRVLCPCSIPFAGKMSETKIEMAETVENPHEEEISLQNLSVVNSPKQFAQDSAKAAFSQISAEKEKAKSENKATEKGNLKKKSGEENGVKAQKSDTSSVSSSKPSYHLVRKGDNVYKISRKYYGSDNYVPAIIKLNKLHDANNIVVGKRLRLP